MTNVAVVVGNLTRDPEMRYTPGGQAVTEFTVAVNEGFGEKRTTQFIRCVAWDKLAESVAERARKGSKVVVDGRLATDSWKNKEGKTQERTRIIARGVQIVSGRVAPESSAEAQEPLDLSDLPF